MNAISGKTEFQIFKNFYTATKMESCSSRINTLTLECKDNAKSDRLRHLVETDFAKKNYNLCLEKYTESLRFAAFKGREYALALANRSATYFSMENYKNCLIDIDLCLQGDYPVRLHSKMCIRKAKCYKKMGNFKKLIETVDHYFDQIEDRTFASQTETMNHVKEVMYLKELIQPNFNQVKNDFFVLEEVPLSPEVVLEGNQQNPNISASIKFKYYKNSGTDYVAARDIPCGEILFTDKAYSIIGSMLDCEEDSLGMFVCDYCCHEAKNCIPCKTCTNLVYCSENCLNNSWTEYHQWECDMLRSKILAEDLCLPLRTLIKAAFSGAIFQIPNNAGSSKFVQNVDPYMDIYSLHLDLAGFRSKCTSRLVKSCEQAVLMVEFLKRTDFFTRLMSTPSCQKDYPALVNLVGGLLIKHIIQLYQKSVSVQSASSIATVNNIEGRFEVLLASKSMKYQAFCPVVSGVKPSCESNTSMYFNGSTCIVKACTNIEAGTPIFRSGFNLTPIVPYHARRLIYSELNITCDCTPCADINKGSDILNTFLCIRCNEFTLLELMPSSTIVCTNCKSVRSTETIQSVINLALTWTAQRENARGSDSRDLEKAVANLTTLKVLLNPNHEYMYKGYKKLLLMLSQQGRENIEKFKDALHDFKTCAKNRNGRFDSYQYVIDLIVICKACLAFIQLNLSDLAKQKTMEMCTYLLNVIYEARKLAEFIFPPLLGLFASMECFVFKFSLAHVLK